MPIARLWPLALLAGCTNVLGDFTVAPAPQVTVAQQACLDTANAVAQAAVRCGLGTYKANFDTFVQDVANGNCANIVQVRDEATLRGTCIPSLSSISCANLQASMLDPSCDNQLLHP